MRSTCDNCKFAGACVLWALCSYGCGSCFGELITRQLSLECFVMALSFVLHYISPFISWWMKSSSNAKSFSWVQKCTILECSYELHRPAAELETKTCGWYTQGRLSSGKKAAQLSCFCMKAMFVYNMKSLTGTFGKCSPHFMRSPCPACS